jgi:hypothetical protein
MKTNLPAVTGAVGLKVAFGVYVQSKREDVETVAFVVAVLVLSAR